MTKIMSLFSKALIARCLFTCRNSVPNAASAAAFAFFIHAIGVLSSFANAQDLTPFSGGASRPIYQVSGKAGMEDRLKGPDASSMATFDSFPSRRRRTKRKPGRFASQI
jgi:hypothetical protein